VRLAVMLVLAWKELLIAGLRSKIGVEEHAFRALGMKMRTSIGVNG
jgi:hypothetical protein